MVNPREVLFRNIASNWGLMVLSAVVAFFLNPFLVHRLGTDRYGIWSLVWSAIAYTAFLDAGLKQSLARFIPKHYATGDYPKLNEVINSSQFIYNITGTLVVIAGLIISLLAPAIFNVKPELHRTMQIVFVLIGLTQALRFYFMTGTALGPFHRYDMANAVEVVVLLVNTFLIVYFIYAGYGLVALGVITLAVTAGNFLVRRLIQQKLVPQITFSFDYMNKERIRELLGYGVISFFIVVAWMVIFNSGNVIIGIFLTTTDVTYYSIAAMIINYFRTIVNAIGVPLVPAISHLDTTSGMDEISRLYRKLTRYLYYLCTGICVAVFFFGHDFISLWMGPGFETTSNVLYILILPACIYLPQIMANSVLLGISKHKALFYVLAGEALGNILLSVILVQYLGVYGVALGLIIPQFIIYTFIFPLVFHRIIGSGVRTFYARAVRMILFSGICTVPISFLLYRYVDLDTWGGFLIKGSVWALFLGIGFWWKILDQDTKLRLKAKIPGLNQ